MSAPPGLSGPDYLAFLFSVSHRSGRLATSQTSTSGLLTTKRLIGDRNSEGVSRIPRFVFAQLRHNLYLPAYDSELRRTRCNHRSRYSSKRRDELRSQR
jgi:hypothetical protein